MDSERLYTSSYFLALAYNFLVALNFTNNAIYPLFVTHAGGSAATVGLFMSAFAIASVLGRPVIGPLIDRFGVRPVMILGSACIALPPIGYWLLLDSGLSPLVWLLRIVQGFGFGAHFTAFFTMAAHSAPSHRRTESVAMYGISGLAANLFGPLMGEWLVTSFGLSYFFISLTVIGIVSVFFATRIIEGKTGDRSADNRIGFLSILKSHQLLLPLALAIFMAIAFSTPLIFLAPLAVERAIGGFSLYFSSYAVAGITIRLIGRKWADRFGWRRILIPMFSLFSAGILLIYFSPDLLLLMIAGLLNGTAHGLSFPAITSLGYTLAPAQAKGTSMALITGTMDLGVFLNGVIMGMIAKWGGYDMVFLITPLVPLLAVGVLVIHVLRKPLHMAQAVVDD